MSPYMSFLKDIFPLNVVDLGMFSTNNAIYWLFRRKERKYYKLSDRIDYGYMSSDNCELVIKYNPEVVPKNV